MSIDHAFPMLDHLPLSFYYPQLCQNIGRTARIPRLLLLDDDALFGRVMKRCAQQHFVPFQVISDPEAMKFLRDREFDLLIVDYDLGSLTALDLLPYLPSQVPMIMISYTDRSPKNEVWPEAIERFILKQKGPEQLIKEAIEVYESRDHLVKPKFKNAKAFLRPV